MKLQLFYVRIDISSAYSVSKLTKLARRTNSFNVNTASLTPTRSRPIATNAIETEKILGNTITPSSANSAAINSFKTATPGCCGGICFSDTTSDPAGTISSSDKPFINDSSVSHLDLFLNPFLQCGGCRGDLRPSYCGSPAPNCRAHGTEPPVPAPRRGLRPASADPARASGAERAGAGGRQHQDYYVVAAAARRAWRPLARAVPPAPARGPAPNLLPVLGPPSLLMCHQWGLGGGGQPRQERGQGGKVQLRAAAARACRRDTRVPLPGTLSLFLMISHTNQIHYHE